MVFKIKKPRFIETRAKTIKKEEAKRLPLYPQRIFQLNIVIYRDKWDSIPVDDYLSNKSTFFQHSEHGL